MPHAPTHGHIQHNQGLQLPGALLQHLFLAACVSRRVKLPCHGTNVFGIFGQSIACKCTHLRAYHRIVGDTANTSASKYHHTVVQQVAGLLDAVGLVRPVCRCVLPAETCASAIGGYACAMAWRHTSTNVMHYTRPARIGRVLSQIASGFVRT